MAEHSGASLDLVDLQVRFPKADTLALSGVDLNVSAGERFVILGPSGSGKTTLLRTVAGFLRPASHRAKRDPLVRGRVLFDSMDVTTLEPQDRNVAMVRQSWDLLPHLSVRDNLALPLRLRHVSRDEADRRIQLALSRLELEKVASKRASELSGGEIQRTAIGRLLVRTDARAYLFDECLSSLDPVLRARLLRELTVLLGEHRLTTLWVTHLAEEARHIADRVGIMDGGRLIQTGTVAEVDEQPASLLVFRLMTGQVEAQTLKASVVGGHLHGPTGPLPWPAIGDADGDVHVCVRPGGWRFTDGGPFAGVVERSVSTSYRRYLVSVVLDGWTAEVESDKPLQAGDTVHLAAEKSSVVFFDGGDGSLLQANEPQL